MKIRKLLSLLVLISGVLITSCKNGSDSSKKSSNIPTVSSSTTSSSSSKHEHVYEGEWLKNEEGHYKECTTEGCDAKTETTAHSGGTATCKAKGTCSECGEAYGEFAAHTWEEKVDADFLASKATCTTKATYYKSCAVCGDTSDETFEGGDLLPHSGGTATCVAKAICDVCEQPYGEFADHIGGTADCQNKAVCEVCSQPYGELSTTHNWNENEYVNKTATGHSHPCTVNGCQEDI